MSSNASRAYAAEPLRKARLFARALNLPEAQSPIVPLIVGDSDAALAAAHSLDDDGFLVVAIRPPTVPRGTARLRFAFTAQHPDAEIERLAESVRRRVTRCSVTAIFITATGTDVGKTFVTASLIGHFRQMGRIVEAIKPVVSGFDPAQAATSDPGLLFGRSACRSRPTDRAHFAVAVSRATVARSGGTARTAQHQCRRRHRLLPKRDRAAARSFC